VTDAAVIRFAPLRLNPAEREQALAALSTPERERWAAVAPESFLTGRHLLRTLVTELTGRANVEISATCATCGGPHGRPEAEGVWLSLSRCAVGLVAAACDRAPVGVDVETTGTELRWTRVEAVLKADGRGLRVDPADVTIVDGFGSIAGSGARYRVSEVDLDPRVVVSLAVREDSAGRFRTARSRTGR